MKRLMAAWLAACLALPSVPSAARAQAPAAAPFPTGPHEMPPPPSHGWAYLTMGTGVVLIGSSFWLSSKGDQAYSDYLNSTDPDEIESLYQHTLRYDRYAVATLLTGEALVATGLYLRFIRRPAREGLGFALLPGRCVVSYRF